MVYALRLSDRLNGNTQFPIVILICVCLSRPGEVVHADSVQNIEGEGMPQFKNPFLKGNLLVKIKVEFPENHFADEKTLKVRKNSNQFSASPLVKVKGFMKFSFIFRLWKRYYRHVNPLKCRLVTMLRRWTSMTMRKCLEGTMLLKRVMMKRTVHMVLVSVAPSNRGRLVQN